MALHAWRAPILLYRSDRASNAPSLLRPGVRPFSTRLRMPSVTERLRDQGAASLGGRADSFEVFLEGDRVKRARLVRERGIAAEWL